MGFARLVTPGGSCLWRWTSALTICSSSSRTDRRFITGTRKAGSWCLLAGRIPRLTGRTILIAEGWATAASWAHRHGPPGIHRL